MAIKAETSFSLKDQLFNETSVSKLATGLRRAQPKFRDKEFLDKSLAAFPELELKARIAFMADLLAEFLPKDFGKAVAVLEKALPPPLDPALTDDDFGEFIWSVPAEFVAQRGCRAESLQTSLAFLREATQRFSVENAIRPFLNAFPVETMAFIHACAADNNYHVRRLASEGIRPLLPWAPRVNLPLPDIVEVLAKLYRDPTRYVTRSVANNLNDIAKIDPDLVVGTLASWPPGDVDEFAWLKNHALRTLLKHNDPGAMALMGYLEAPVFRIAGVAMPDNVSVGDNLDWSATLTSGADQRLRVTLRVHFLKANGQHSPKVFALADQAVTKGEKLNLKKRVSFRPMTTRTLYPGEHRIEVVVNGIARASRSFVLKG